MTVKTSVKIGVYGNQTGGQDEKSKIRCCGHLNAICSLTLYWQGI